jgi:hypothetical protein
MRCVQQGVDFTPSSFRQWCRYLSTWIEPGSIQVRLRDFALAIHQTCQKSAPAWAQSHGGRRSAADGGGHRRFGPIPGASSVVVNHAASTRLRTTVRFSASSVVPNVISHLASLMGLRLPRSSNTLPHAHSTPKLRVNGAGQLPLVRTDRELSMGRTVAIALSVSMGAVGRGHDDGIALTGPRQRASR